MLNIYWIDVLLIIDSCTNHRTIFVEPPFCDINGARMHFRDSILYE